MVNAWLTHVKQFRKQNPGLQFKDLLQQARKSYRGGTPVSHVGKGIATNASKVGGGDPVAYESQNLASRSAKLGGSRRRRRQTRKQKKSRQSR
jgi:hypothetical protein